MKIKFTWPAIILSLLLVTAVAAQQSPSRPAPTLTTDEVKSRAVVTETKVAPSTSTAADQQDKRQEEAERVWNERWRQAREKVKDLERRADQAELEINRLRNYQFSPEAKDASASNQVNLRIAELTELASRLRTEAKAARAELDAIVAEGEAHNYHVLSLSPTTKSGEPNLEYYRSRYAELESDLRDANARAEVLQLRINELRFRINNNARTGDNFFLGRLRGELQEAESDLETVRARQAKLSQQLDEFLRQARLAGIALGELK